MAVSFLDEMIDALNELRLSEAQRVYEAVKNKELPPLTMSPATVLKTVHQVALKHQITREEFLGMLGVMNSSGFDHFSVGDYSEWHSQKEE